MSTVAASYYKEQKLNAAQIDALAQTLEEDCAEVTQYRSEDRRVWVNLDHVEAIAIDEGKVCTWKMPNGTHADLRNVLMRRFLDAVK